MGRPIEKGMLQGWFDYGKHTETEPAILNARAAISLCEKGGTMTPRVLIWFSCGGPSAVASKRGIEMFSDTHEVIPINCDTRSSEHPDNYRFTADCERWFGRPIVHVKSDKYETVDEVFERTSYMSGIAGARCTTELKKLPRLAFARPDDIHVFGYTLEEKRRADDFAENNPELLLRWLLIELGLDKADCLLEIAEAGIQQPEMYRLGFDNNNCPGCVKASSPWYWDMIRRLFPEVFARRCVQSRKIGCRLVEIHHHERIFLDELPPGPFKKPRKRENLSCGPGCGIQTRLRYGN